MKKYNYVYKITNLLNNKIYIGKHSTDDINDGYMGSGTLLKRSLKKYGIENFKKEYLAFCDTEDKLNFFERFYIKKYNSNNSNIGYNLTYGGDGMLGYRHTEETRKKISESEKGEKSVWFGRHHTEETRKKIGEALKGKKRKPFTEETRKRMSESGKGKHNHFGEKNPNYKGGKKEKTYVPKDVWRKHISEGRKGCIPWNLGKKWSEDVKNKLSASKKGTHRVYDNVEHTKWHMEKINTDVIYEM